MFDAHYRLYQSCFAALPVERDVFRQRLGLDDGTHMLERHADSQLTAFAAVRGDGLLMLCVDPSQQGRGLGSGLLAEAEALARSVGHDRVVLGHGGGRYLMQGVPDVADKAFFEHRGYQATWTSVDMALQLARFSLNTLPGYPYGPCQLRLADHADGACIRAVEQVDPSWVPFYQQASALALAEADGQIASFIILAKDGMPFAPSFPGCVAGLGCLGTVPALRSRGIGLTLAAYATDVLRREGFDHSYLGYTWLEQWYGRLGYRTFRSFWMGEKAL